jgi:hypothetical protein
LCWSEKEGWRRGKRIKKEEKEI